MSARKSATDRLATLFHSQTGAMASYAIALFIMKGLSLIMLPIITRYLAPSEMGQLEILAVTGALMGIFFSVALHEALYRFAGEAKGSKQKCIANQLFTLTFLFSFIAGLFFLVLIATSEWPSDWELEKNPVLILFGSLTIEGALAMSLAWLRMQDRARIFSLICIMTSTLQVTLVLISLELGYGIEGVLASGFIAHLLQLTWVVKTSQLQFQLPPALFVKTSLRYTAPIMLSGLCAFGLNGAERWFILEGESFTTLGHYAIAAKFALAMCILVQPFGMWWMPKRFAMLDSNPENATRITEKGIAYICLLALSISLFGQWALEFILTDTYTPASQLLIGALFMVLGKEVCELVNLGLLKQKKTSTLFYINLITACAALLCLALTYHFGIWSIIITIGAAQLLRASAIFYFSQRTFPMPYQIHKVGFMILATLVGMYLLHQLESVLSLIVVWFICCTSVLWVVAPRVTAHLNLFSRPSSKSL
ncbi:lipopolysaccharide biosynthesis protein [Vibrio agarivorans]|uniref:Lipopolysaccharide biosynthesis protein n=1 Tax=Vibrio agarivorans TaxID=153622 RepID=A0ABT7XYM5_9VIBR|nr:hypothetical protein [Vibrio agarivorans]MDN2480880.1 hypothetical protein [Vibrio agarivorans]